MFDNDYEELLFFTRSKRYERCQCDTEFGTCPGVQNCPYSDYQDDTDNQQGEEDES